MARSYDYFIAGGGIIGSSIAMALSVLGAKGIAVVDCDLSGKWSSSERNAGGVRAAWGAPVNVALSKDSIAFYEQAASEIGFQQKGYLWLYEKAAWPGILKQIELWNHSGCPTKSLTPAEIQTRFPFLDRLTGVSGAVFSEKDGLINPNLLKTYYRGQVPANEIDWIDHRIIEAVEKDAGCVRAVRLGEVRSEDAVEAFLTGQRRPFGATGERVEVKTFINAAGAWAPDLARLYGQQIPSVPIRRQVAVVHCHEADLSPYGMMVDASGLYFHHEAGNILAGYASPSEPEGYRFAYDGSDFFMDEIWPRLAARSSVFDRLKMIGGWAGLYGVSPDHSAIIGAVEGFENVYEAHSFAGHGVMQSYAAGRALAELILQGEYQTIDLSILSGHRFQHGHWVSEAMLI